MWLGMQTQFDLWQAAHYHRHAYTDEKRAALVAWEARLEAIRQAERTLSNVARRHSRELHPDCGTHHRTRPEPWHALHLRNG